MMQAGECYNEANPLTVAIDKTSIDVGCLSLSYNAKTRSSSLKPAAFTAKSPTLELLAGRHRLLASQQVAKNLQRDISKFEKGKGKAKKSDVYAEHDSDPDAAEAWDQAMSASLDVIAKATVWPVDFYDISESRPPSSAWTTR